MQLRNFARAHREQNCRCHCRKSKGPLQIRLWKPPTSMWWPRRSKRTPAGRAALPRHDQLPASKVQSRLVESRTLSGGAVGAWRHLQDSHLRARFMWEWLTMATSSGRPTSWSPSWRTLWWPTPRASSTPATRQMLRSLAWEAPAAHCKGTRSRAVGWKSLPLGLGVAQLELGQRDQKEGAVSSRQFCKSNARRLRYDEGFICKPGSHMTQWSSPTRLFWTGAYWCRIIHAIWLTCPRFFNPAALEPGLAREKRAPATTGGTCVFCLFEGAPLAFEGTLLCLSGFHRCRPLEKVPLKGAQHLFRYKFLVCACLCQPPTLRSEEGAPSKPAQSPRVESTLVFLLGGEDMGRTSTKFTVLHEATNLKGMLKYEFSRMVVRGSIIHVPNMNSEKSSSCQHSLDLVQLDIFNTYTHKRSRLTHEHSYFI